MKKRKTLDQFLKDAKNVHGKEYDYSKVVYIDAKTKVKIICSKHGEFEQIPDNHTNRGDGCSKCYGTPKKTKNRFIEESIMIHGSEYDYSKVIYINTHVNCEILCRIHGSFWQTPKGHIHRKWLSILWRL